MKIYPSVLEKDADSLFDRLNHLVPHFDHFQIDISDNIFVNGTTAQPQEITTYLDTNPDANPLKENTTTEFHLMVQDFEHLIPSLKKLKEPLNITKLILHFTPLQLWIDRHIGNQGPSASQNQNTQQSTPQDQNTNESSKTSNHPTNQRTDTNNAPGFLKKYFGYEFGVALNPEVKIQPNIGVLKQFDHIQLMTVEPGAQGRPFKKNIIEKVDALRGYGYQGKITLDGAMNEESLKYILNKPGSFWPDAICPGSYFHENPAERLKTLESLINHAVMEAEHA